ncbi:uncharacterized protein C8Q71DRAFT_418986 [Rhodofomes roseus]|uniref:Secreted protein n=1 Tax=Rhodofomes roseus TaxID=34475 RepID=A0ABQ8KPX5_9APHY|nr:uncharacterized protein C8Q71DRAFT_418986 [Rhodofomes roseus]KAH9840668.1 hypothetical protein C8Q71DRAFT_418986 [Rhodofomes roseus]
MPLWLALSAAVTAWSHIGLSLCAELPYALFVPCRLVLCARFSRNPIFAAKHGARFIIGVESTATTRIRRHFVHRSSTTASTALRGTTLSSSIELSYQVPSVHYSGNLDCSHPSKRPAVVMHHVGLWPIRYAPAAHTSSTHLELDA